MARNNFHEKRAARLENLERLEIKTAKDAEAFFERSRSMTDCIPMGQPILVGHHSERSHRRLLDRSWNMLGKAVKTKRKAEYWRYKQEAMAYYDQKVISSDDPDRLEKLQDKIYTLEARQEKYKAINKIVKSKKLSEAEKVEELMNTFQYSEENAATFLEPDFCGRVGIPSYMLQNNGAKLRSTKKRLEELEHQLTKQIEAIHYGDGLWVINDPIESNRVRIFFPDKPEADTRTALKRNGFRWSPSASEYFVDGEGRWNLSGAWQKNAHEHYFRQAKTIVEDLGFEKIKSIVLPS